MVLNMGRDFINISEEEIERVLIDKIKNNKLMNTIDMNSLIRAAIGLFNHMNRNDTCNSNVTIYTEDQNVSNLCGEVLGETIEYWFPNSGGFTSEEVLYNHEAGLSKLKEYGFVLVKNYMAYSAEELFLSLNEIKENDWSPAIILCTTKSAIENIKSFEKQDHRLFYYLCGTKVYDVDINEGNIAEKTFEELEHRGYILTDAFRKKLGIYISAVYDDACLTGMEFLEDLIERILQLRNQKIIYGMELEVTDVPYSDKAQALEESRKVLKNVEDREIKTLSISEKTGAEDAEEPFNILITNVSTVALRDGKTQKRIYQDEDGNIFSGVMTNEAPIKSILHRLGQQGKCLDKIIFIESDRVRKSAIKSGDSHVELLQKRIHNFIGNIHIDYEHVGIKDEPTKNDVSETVFEIYNKLISWASEKRSINIFIESNGGVRYVLTMLLSLTKTLENYYSNIHISEITSMVLNQNPVMIKNTKDVFDTAQITGIADEFVNYGRTHSLHRYIEGYMDEFTPSQKADVNKVLDKLYKLADDMQLCRTRMMMDDLYGTDNIRMVIEGFVGKYSNEDVPAALSILEHILNLILNELKLGVYKGIEKTEPGNSIIYLPKTIEWCLNKSFVQQAVTLCAERFPEYLFETGKIQISTGLASILDETDKGEYEEKYYFIAHLKDFVQNVNNTKINAVLRKIKNLGRIRSLSESDWNDSVFINDGLPDADLTDRLAEIAVNVSNLLSYYENTENVNTKSDDWYESLFIRNGFEISDLNYKVAISKKITANPMIMTMKGLYYKDGEIDEHPNLRTIDKRIIKIMPALIEAAINRDMQILFADAKNEYNGIIDGLFTDETLQNDLKGKYSDWQSRKFYIKDTMATGNISSNIEEQKLQRLLYVYSLCKEQRNLSNHARVADENIPIALNSDKLIIVVQELLKCCEA